MRLPVQGGGAAAPIHSDDFLATARRDSSEELNTAMAQRGQVESVILGPGSDRAKELLILRRKVVSKKDRVDYK